MAIRRYSIGLTIASILVVGIWLPGFAPQATGETWNFKGYNPVRKMEMVPIDDVEGHTVSLTVREGLAVFENGERAWVKATIIRDLIKGAGTGDMYDTLTFMDGSIVTAHMKGVVGATAQGVAAGTKWTGPIIYGMGRFKGVTGTITTSSKLLLPEKGEPEGIALVDGTLAFTWPSK